jgi:hypothetical protein
MTSDRIGCAVAGLDYGPQTITYRITVSYIPMPPTFSGIIVVPFELFFIFDKLVTFVIAYGTNKPGRFAVTTMQPLGPCKLIMSCGNNILDTIMNKISINDTGAGHGKRIPREGTIHLLRVRCL